MGLNTATQDAILNFVMGAMFIILPMFWMGALGWAGVSARMRASLGQRVRRVRATDLVDDDGGD